MYTFIIFSHTEAMKPLFKSYVYNICVMSSMYAFSRV